LANLLNDPGVHQPSGALAAVKAAQDAAQACTTWQAAALQESIDANRRLGEYAAARTALERYLAIKGPDGLEIGQSLLEYLHQAVLLALDRDEPAAVSVAQEGAALAAVLEKAA